MLKKWVKQTAMQVSAIQNSCWRSTHLLTWVLQKDIHSVYTKWSMEWMNMHTCWNKGHSKIPLHTIINMQLVAAGSSRQVKIGLSQFDNCPSQVKINVTTVNNSYYPTMLKICDKFFVFLQESPWTLETVIVFCL